MLHAHTAVSLGWAPAPAWMDLEHMKLREKPDQEATVCDSIHMTRPEQVQHRWEADQWLPGAGGRGESGWPVISMRFLLQ